MSLVLLIVVALLFILGMRASAELASTLRTPEERQRLLLRIAGFLVLGIWLHALPVLLLIIYMRHEGVMVPELLQEANSATIAIGLYTGFGLVVLAVVASAGAIVAAVRRNRWRVFSVPTVAGYLLASGFIYLDGYDKIYGYSFYNWSRVGFLLFAVVPIVMYLHLTILTPLDKQTRLYPVPFILVVALTFVLFAAQPHVYELVSSELWQFRVGGNPWVHVKHKERTVFGTLVLISDEAIYVRVPLEVSEVGATEDSRKAIAARSRGCLMRLPLKESVVTFAPLWSGDIQQRNVKESVRRHEVEMRELCAARVPAP